MYELFMTRDAHRFYEEADPVLARKLNRCFETLRDDPYRHPNVKRLKGPLAGYLRYRVGDWRVVYEVQEQEERVIVIVIDDHPDRSPKRGLSVADSLTLCDKAPA